MEKFSHYKREDYEAEGVIPIDPMCAKEPLNDKELEEMLTSQFFYAEEKLDGVRATLHIREEGNRIFSRRISKKTDWFAEKSDNVPHIRDLKVDHEFYGTILDGELRIEGGDFKDISSIMNCLPQEAIKRQETLGKVVLHAFDIIYYKGIYVAKMPLWKRKKLLSHMVEQLNCPYIVEELFISQSIQQPFTQALKDDYLNEKDMLREKYPNLYECLENTLPNSTVLTMNKKQWYEYIVYNGGEGLMLKNINGTYKHQRCREYTKLKKFETWDCVVYGYTEPTEEYTGDHLETWQYWGMYRQGHLEEIIEGEEPMPWTRDHHVEPVTKHFAKGWIGTIQLGIIVTNEELEKWEKANKKKAEFRPIEGGQLNLMYIGECGGFTESVREEISKNKDKYMLQVLEVKGHEVSKKTGGIRHPRFLRWREDKGNLECTWKDHIRA